MEDRHARTRRLDLDVWRQPLEDFHAGLAERLIKADFSTVFRAAEKLVTDGMLAKVMVDDGRARFELAGSHHDHLHCTVCDEVIAIPCLFERPAIAGLEAEFGVVVIQHQVVLSGLCAACRPDGLAV